MALTMKKKHSYVFNPSNYSKGSLESKVEK